jgi:hypothetical protein
MRSTLSAERRVANAAAILKLDEPKTNEGALREAVGWVRCGEWELLDLLLDHGADINAEDDQGETCLHKMLTRAVNEPFAHKPSEEWVRGLCARGLDPAEQHSNRSYVDYWDHWEHVLGFGLTPSP